MFGDLGNPEPLLVCVGSGLERSVAASNASKTGNRIVWTLGIGLAALAFGLAVTLIWAILKNRLRRSELAQRDGALLLLTEAIKSTAAHPGAVEFHSALKTSIRIGSKGTVHFWLAHHESKEHTLIIHLACSLR
jgi:hypothetical protein